MVFFKAYASISFCMIRRVTSLEQLSLAVNKRGERSMKTAIKMFGIERQNLGAFLENKEH